MKKRKYKYYFGLATFCLLLYITTIVVYCVLVTLDVIDQTLLSSMLLTIFITATLSFFCIFIILFFNEFIRYKSFMRESEYNFGRQIEFTDIGTFRKNVERKLRKTSTMSFLFSFAPIKTSINYEGFQERSILSLYSQIAEFIKTYFEGEMQLKPRYYDYSFDNHNFFVFIIGDMNLVNTVIKAFEGYVYDVVSKRDLNVIAQPYVGIYRIENRELSIYDIIDKAILAKRIGENNYNSVTMYDETMSQNDIVLENYVDKMRKGLRNNEFEVYYQPKFNQNRKEFVGLEALVRWNSKEGLVSPAMFIGIAEKCGLIHEIDTFVINRVCEDLADWRRRGRELLPISVNYSLIEFYIPSFLDDFVEAVNKNRVDTKYIQIEITESTSPASTFMIISILNKLRQMGVKILLDDFGSGFSNINSIMELPIDIIKLDKTLIDDIETNGKSKEMLKTILAFANINKQEVIAEGVTNENQLNILKRMNCAVIQGSYYSGPLDKKKLEVFLISNPFSITGGRIL